MKGCYFSKRCKKETIFPEAVTEITEIMKTFNIAKHTSYSNFVNREYFDCKFEDSVHMMIKSRFGFNDYFANSAVQQGKATFSSNKELQEYYIEEESMRLENSKKKLKDLEKQYSNKEKVRKSLVKLSKEIDAGKKFSKFKTYKGADEYCSISKNGNIIFAVRHKKRTDLYFTLWEFEYNYLVPKMKNIKNRIKHLKYGIYIREQKLEKLKMQPYFSCFGSKKLFKAQYTLDKYKDDNNLWREDFHKARYSSMQISGRLDAKGGNFVFRYDIVSHSLFMTTSEGNIIEFPNVTFPYGQDNVDYAVTAIENRKAVAWAIEDHGDYYIFKCIVELPKKDLNYSKSDGVISCDINIDRLAWSNIDCYGNRLNGGVIYFDLIDKTSGQAAKIVERMAIELAALAEKYKKPIVIEKLDTEKSKSFLKYGSKKRNAVLSQFAYKKIIEAITSRAYKCGIYVYSVNPKFTSQIGKFKYMRKYCISIHEAASYVIGRRGLGLKEKVHDSFKKYLSEDMLKKHHWSHWSYFTRNLKDIPAYCFYKEYSQNFSDLKELKNTIISDFQLAN